MRGRKPVPTVIKIARGNPSKTALPKHELTPSRHVDLAVPASLGADPLAAAHWAELAPMLHRNRLLTEADLGALRLLCLTLARLDQAEQALREDGMVYVTPTGRRASPWIGIAREAHRQVRSLMSEFGLTPAARTRITAAPPTEADEETKFFGHAESA